MLRTSSFRLRIGKIRFPVKKESFAAGHGRTRCYNPARFRGEPTAQGLSKAFPSTRSSDAQIAQLVEQRIENPRVAGSIPALGTTTKFRNFPLLSDAWSVLATSERGWSTLLRPYDYQVGRIIKRCSLRGQVLRRFDGRGGGQLLRDHQDHGSQLKAK